MILLRTQIGQALRAARIEQKRTLREVAKAARVSLGYLSEVERGQKEASSELLNAICSALDLPLSKLLTDVTTVVVASESPVIALQVVDTAA
jgi:transcriptional regulator with XRE-family HTH domain